MPRGGDKEVKVRTKHVAQEVLDPKLLSINNVPNSTAGVKNQLPALQSNKTKGVQVLINIIANKHHILI